MMVYLDIDNASSFMVFNLAMYLEHDLFLGEDNVLSSPHRPSKGHLSTRALLFNVPVVLNVVILVELKPKILICFCL
jgi:hypothetical protein